MGKRDRDFQWTGDYFVGKKVSFAFANPGTWQLIHKISEKTCQIYHLDPFELVTVYVCEKVSGEGVGQRAIMKLRTEYVERACAEPIAERKTKADYYSRILGTEFPHPNPQKHGPISEDVNQATVEEVEWLEQPTEAGCTSTPRLLAYQRLNQTEKQWLPGGYVVCILMQLVPGISLECFRELPREERDEA
jgi:hypothetical protein